LPPDLASSLLAAASEQVQLCHALLDALADQRQALLARDAPAVLLTCREIETLLENMARASTDRAALESEIASHLSPAVGDLSPTTLGRCLPKPHRQRWCQLNADLAALARRARAANDFNQQLAMDALAYQDLLLGLLSGHVDSAAYARQRPARTGAPLPVFLNQSA
jgi:hypothetical protein